MGIFIIGFYIIWRTVHSPFGQVLQALRENEPRAISLGYDVDRFKLLAFVLSAAIAGLAGATKTLVFVSATLSDATWQMSGLVILMTLIGGLGTLTGPILGAFIVVLLENKVGDFGQALAKLTGVDWFLRLGESVTIVIGLIFVICVLAFRRGIVGELAAFAERRRAARADAVRHFVRNRAANRGPFASRQPPMQPASRPPPARPRRLMYPHNSARQAPLIRNQGRDTWMPFTGTTVNGPPITPSCSARPTMPSGWPAWCSARARSAASRPTWTCTASAWCARPKMLMKPQLGWEAIQDLCLQAVAKFPEGTELYIKPMFYCADGFLLPTPTAPNSCCTYSRCRCPANFSACFSSFARSWSNMAPTDAKASCLYPNGQRAIRDAANRGFDNAIMLDGDGNIAEFATSNLWIVKNGVVSTPVDNGTFLNGITRRRVLALLADGVEVQERSLTRADVESADEVFSSGNYGKVVHVNRVEDRALEYAGRAAPTSSTWTTKARASADTHPPRAAAPAGRLHVEQTRLPAHRRRARGAAGALGLFPAAIRRALAIEPDRRSGTLRDVEHIVVLMQENRSFDHYFGLAGVRGFGDRFPIPVPASPEHERRSVWSQYNDSTDGGPRTVLPFRLDTRAAFEAMRIASTPHTWSNAQQAWDDGRMGFGRRPRKSLDGVLRRGGPAFPVRAGARLHHLRRLPLLVHRRHQRQPVVPVDRHQRRRRTRPWPRHGQHLQQLTGGDLRAPTPGPPIRNGWNAPASAGASTRTWRTTTRSIPPPASRPTATPIKACPARWRRCAKRR